MAGALAPASGRGRGRRPLAGGRGRGGGGGDWSCAGCGNFNYKFRDECNKCKAPRDAAAPSSSCASQGSLPLSHQVAPGESSGAVKANNKTAGGARRPGGRGKGPRQRVKQLTQKIIQFAKRKRLGEAQQVFAQMVDEGLEPSLLTFSAYINAHVASGDMLGAEKAFRQMTAASVQPNGVIYNTLFKGYCVAGNTARTAELFQEMAGQGVTPDTNTVNAHLSGCLRAGDVGDAHDVFTKMTGDWAAEPDFFTYKREVQMLSRGLRLEALDGIHHTLLGYVQDEDEKGPGFAGSSGPKAALVWLHLHRGLSAALLGRWSVAVSDLRQVEAAGAAAAVAPEVHLARRSEESPGDRGQHDFHERMFQQEVTRLRDFLEAQQVLQGGKKAAKVPPPDLRGAFCRTFIFGAHTNAQGRKQQGGAETETAGQEGQKLAAGLLRSLERTFGLDACAAVGLLTLRETEERLRRLTSRDGRLRWQKVFKPKRQRDDEEAEVCSPRGGDLPVKLEICSGFGEWVVAQAEAEAGSAHWAALELRYDRCHSIFSRMVFQGVRNLCILGGDASQVLPAHVAPGSVDHIFINFPEPPQTNMLSGAESHLHLLTPAFFREMHRTLRQGGRITVLHDEHRYCCLLARTLASLQEEDGERLFKSVLGLRGKKKTRSDWEDIGGIRLYYGVPGKKSGHVVRSTSYFDQLWEEKDRFFLVVSKC